MSRAQPQPRLLPKRFYEKVELHINKRTYGLRLDGKELKTTARNPLIVKRRPLADALVAEWEAQKEFINPDLMPLTRLCNIAIDRVPVDKPDLLRQICAYGETDLLCYRDEGELAALQAKQFDPILNWLRKHYGMKLHITTGLMPMVQPETVLQKLQEVFAEAKDAELAALAMLTPLLGSVFLALALWKQRITVEKALKLARLEEDFQAAKWGEDSEAAALWAARVRDIRAAAFFLDMQTTKKSK